MAVFGDPEGKTVISLSHGRHCDERIFYESQEELAKLGFPSISHTYDVESGEKKVEDHARQRDEEIHETGAVSSINTGWSWGAGPAIWPEQNGIPVLKTILVAGALHRNLLRWASGTVPDAIHDLRYDAYERNPGPEAYRELARTHIFTDVEDDQVIELWATRMRDHPRIKNESILKLVPRIPIDYIVIRGDKATLNQEDIARGLGERADVKPIVVNGDHAIMVSKPKMFAEMIAKRTLVVKNVSVPAVNYN